MKNSIKYLFSAVFFLLFALPVSIFAQERGPFMNNLSLGMSNLDVKDLQAVLNSDTDTIVAQQGPGSKGNETSFFGPATQKAVIRFQNKYSSQILVPVGLVKGNGFVGSLTRAQLNFLFKMQLHPNDPKDVKIATSSPISATTPQSVKSAIPEIDQIVPDHGPYGTEITIIGKNFTNSNDILTTYVPFNAVPSADGTTIKFTLINPPFQKLQQLKDAGKDVPDTDIPFLINIRNQNGHTTVSGKFTIQIRKK